MVETYVALGIVVAFFTLLVSVAYFEKRLISPYAEIEPAVSQADTSPIDRLSFYVVHMCDGAAAHGFRFGSMFAHRKYPMVRIGGTVWMSEDRRTLMHTGSGTVLRMPGKQTWLTSLRRHVDRHHGPER